MSLRITEVEAYHGSDDPGSHAFRGKTKRNAVMFGEPGHLYTYFTYGMHTCANVVCSPEGTASGLLLRGGEVVDGLELARSRRLTSKRDADLARGPARLTVALGITLADGGADLATSHIRLELSDGSLAVRDRAENGAVRTRRRGRLPVALLVAGRAERVAVQAALRQEEGLTPRPDVRKLRLWRGWNTSRFRLMTSRGRRRSTATCSTSSSRTGMPRPR